MIFKHWGGGGEEETLDKIEQGWVSVAHEKKSHGAADSHVASTSSPRVFRGLRGW